MTNSSLIDLASAALLLSGVFIASYSDLAKQGGLLRLQGIALSALPFLMALKHNSLDLWIAGFLVLSVRGLVLPGLVKSAAKRIPAEKDRSHSRISTTTSLLISGASTIVAYLGTIPLSHLDSSSTTKASSIGLALVLIGVQILIFKRMAVGQIVGFLVLDNGIAAFGFLATLGVPLLLELGGSLDLLFAILIMGALTSRMIVKFGTTDVDELSELGDR